VYSIRLHPKLLERELTLTPEERYAVSRKNVRHIINGHTAFNNTGPINWNNSIKDGFNRLFPGLALPIDASGNFIEGITYHSDAYRKYKMAKVILLRGSINANFFINGVQLIELDFHLYDDLDIVRGITPLPKFKSNIPHDIVMSKFPLVKETTDLELTLSEIQVSKMLKSGQGTVGPEQGPEPTVAPQSKHSSKTIKELKTILEEKYGFTKEKIRTDFVEKANIIAELEQQDPTERQTEANQVFTLKAPIDKLLAYAKQILVKLRRQDAPPGIFVGGKKNTRKNRKVKAKTKKTKKH
jgi:hypothetical protein